MKTSNLHFVFLSAVFLLFGVLSVYAQDNTKDQLFYVHMEKANISMLDQYERTNTEVMKMFKEGGMDLPIRASQRDDYLLYFLIPISNYADIDKINEKFRAATEKVGKDKWTSVMMENVEAIESSSEGVATLSAEYSYAPKNPRLKQGEAHFIHWDYFYVKPEKRKEFFEIGKQYKELYSKNNIENGYNVWTAEMGFDNSMVVVSQVAKDDVDYYESQKQDNEKLGKDGEMLWSKLLKTLNKFEHMNGVIRYDLSQTAAAK